jgi:hypothetical protein
MLPLTRRAHHAQPLVWLPSTNGQAGAWWRGRPSLTDAAGFGVELPLLLGCAHRFMPSTEKNAQSPNTRDFCRLVILREDSRVVVQHSPRCLHTGRRPRTYRSGHIGWRHGVYLHDLALASHNGRQTGKQAAVCTDRTRSLGACSVQRCYLIVRRLMGPCPFTCLPAWNAPGNHPILHPRKYLDIL